VANALRAAIHASKSDTQNYSIARFIAQSNASGHGKAARILVLSVAETPALIDVLLTFLTLAVFFHADIQWSISLAGRRRILA
jgi:hypothetical protein